MPPGSGMFVPLLIMPLWTSSCAAATRIIDPDPSPDTVIYQSPELFHYVSRDNLCGIRLQIVDRSGSKLQSSSPPLARRRDYFFPAGPRRIRHMMRVALRVIVVAIRKGAPLTAAAVYPESTPNLFWGVCATQKGEAAACSISRMECNISRHARSDPAASGPTSPATPRTRRCRRVGDFCAAESRSSPVIVPRLRRCF